MSSGKRLLPGALAVLVALWFLLPLDSERKKPATTAPSNEEAAKFQGAWGFVTMCDRRTEKGDRPIEFSAEPDSGLVLVVLKRVQP